VLLNAKFLLYNNRERYIYINMDPRGYALSFTHVTGEDPSKPAKKEAAAVVTSVEKKPSSVEDVAPQGDDKSEDCDLEEALRLSLIQFEEEKKNRQKEGADSEEALRRQRKKVEREQKEKAEREKREKERERVELELKKKAEELRQMLLWKQKEEAERAEALARQKAEKERLEREREFQEQVAQLAAKAKQMAIQEWACPLCTCFLFLSPFIRLYFFSHCIHIGTFLNSPDHLNCLMCNSPRNG